MSAYCIIKRRGAPVVQESGANTQTPQRRGTHFAHTGIGLRDAVGKRAHIV